MYWAQGTGLPTPSTRDALHFQKQYLPDDTNLYYDSKSPNHEKEHYHKRYPSNDLYFPSLISPFNQSFTCSIL